MVSQSEARLRANLMDFGRDAALPPGHVFRDMVQNVLLAEMGLFVKTT